MIEILRTRNQLQQGMLRLSVSRGIGSVGYLPTGDHPPTVVIEVMARAETPSPAAPITLWLSSTRRLSLASLIAFPVLCYNYALCEIEFINNM